MTIWQLISSWPQSLVLGVLITIGVIITVIPLSLRLAGLTGAQIVELLKTTLQFFLSLMTAYLEENKSKG